ncbi:hypothetical protein GYMLUDRAFT_243620 [Collybiopsis luxurians FD-317 M1]|uniref:DUF6532 domain-containing protein n=1 Tax=Collybiopsis luxurians FD-317 M1 TaxID=944289 RepID=A0A0D0CFU0_9AGAR|nr:hypothetical protein GYMLUDRAFT_243620 [Collybiopsis luxurians FD-317 M1]
MFVLRGSIAFGISIGAQTIWNAILSIVIPLKSLKAKVRAANVSLLHDTSHFLADDDTQKEPEDLNLEDMGDGAEAEQDGDELLIEDITELQKATKCPTGSHKVLLADFPFPKATCMIDMYPDNALFAWDTFSNEVQRLADEGRGKHYIEALAIISKDVDKREELIKFMNYRKSAIRFDFGRGARIRMAQYFGISSALSAEEIVKSSVDWLLSGCKFHNTEVDLKGRTIKDIPFKNPLMGLLLQGYFIDGNPQQDKLLVSHLKSIKKIPVPLIAMTATLIHHSLQEYRPGYKVEHDFSATNVACVYHSMTSTLLNLKEMAPTYVDSLQKYLYKAMMTAGPEVIPPRVYDYATLEALAAESALESPRATDSQDQGVAANQGLTDDDTATPANNQDLTPHESGTLD